MARLVRAREQTPSAIDAAKQVYATRQVEFFLNPSMSTVWTALESSFGVRPQEVVSTTSRCDAIGWIIQVDTQNDRFEARVGPDGGLLHIKKGQARRTSAD
jgi:hypothetical protein